MRLASGPAARIGVHASVGDYSLRGECPRPRGALIRPALCVREPARGRSAVGATGWTGPYRAVAPDAEGGTGPDAVN